MKQHLMNTKKEQMRAQVLFISRYLLMKDESITLQINPFYSKVLISDSLYCLLYNSYHNGVSLESLVLDQPIIP